MSSASDETPETVPDKLLSPEQKELQEEQDQEALRKKEAEIIKPLFKVFTKASTRDLQNFYHSSTPELKTTIKARLENLSADLPINKTLLEHDKILFEHFAEEKIKEYSDSDLYLLHKNLKDQPAPVEERDPDFSTLEEKDAMRSAAVDPIHGGINSAIDNVDDHLFLISSNAVKFGSFVTLEEGYKDAQRKLKKLEEADAIRKSGQIPCSSFIKSYVVDRGSIVPLERCLLQTYCKPQLERLKSCYESSKGQNFAKRCEQQLDTTFDCVKFVPGQAMVSHEGSARLYHYRTKRNSEQVFSPNFQKEKN